MLLRSLLALSLCLSLLLAACRPRVEPPPTATERIFASGYLRIGVPPKVLPPKGRPGPAAPAMDRLARMMGAVPNYCPGRLEDLLAALDAGMLDLVVVPGDLFPEREAIPISCASEGRGSREAVRPGLAALVGPESTLLADFLQEAVREAAPPCP